MILVTGGTGFVGRHLIRHRVAAGQPVRVLTRMLRPPDLPQAVQVTTGDLSNFPSLVDALDGVEAVVHLAGCVAHGRATNPRLVEVNVEGTANLVRACVAAGVVQFVHVSSAGVYGDSIHPTPRRETDPPQPGNPYERSKMAGEAALAAEAAGSGLRWVVLRPAGLYGPGRAETAAFFEQVARRRVWMFGPFPVTVHPTNVADLVSAIALTLERPELSGATFNVGGERPLDFRDLIAAVGRCLGRPAPRTISLPDRGFTRWINRALQTVNLPVPPSFRETGTHRAVDIGRARLDLGFQPVPLEVGLEETARWLRDGVA